MSGVVVVGQVARDLVLSVEELPDAGGSTGVLERQELLGGKGANQVVACRQLGAAVRLVGVVGDDRAGEEVVRPEGHAVLPHLDEDPVDPTGGGDAFVAALTVALLRGESPESAAWWAAAAAAQVVGRSDLDLDRLQGAAARARRTGGRR